MEMQALPIHQCKQAVRRVNEKLIASATCWDQPSVGIVAEPGLDLFRPLKQKLRFLPEAGVAAGKAMAAVSEMEGVTSAEAFDEIDSTRTRLPTAPASFKRSGNSPHKQQVSLVMVDSQERQRLSRANAATSVSGDIGTFHFCEQQARSPRTVSTRLLLLARSTLLQSDLGSAGTDWNRVVQDAGAVDPRTSGESTASSERA